jgi:putative nucleotidyltransferase with HDIG domain
VSAPSDFLTAMGRALATMMLYGEGHRARLAAVEAAYDALHRLQSADPRPLFSFLGDEVVYGEEPLRELRDWEWGPRLAAAGVQRVEFDAGVGQEELDEFLDELLARLTLTPVQTSAARQLRESRIKFGTVGIRGEMAPDEPAPLATLRHSFREEAEAVRWVHEEVDRHGVVPLLEAEAVIRSLSVAMHGDQQVVLPLARLRHFDEYTTTHSLNVAVLAMALAEFLGLDSGKVRAYGVAGLLHDIGKVRIPHDILTKPGKLTAKERKIIEKHPVDGARIILESYDHLDMAAVVAYEHHIMLDGGGYPRLRHPRDCHAGSKLAHVCDVYDALRTERPYRDAWPQQKALDYIGERAGAEFDPELVNAFVAMMQQWERRELTLEDDDDATPDEATPTPAAAG